MARWVMLVPLLALSAGCVSVTRGPAYDKKTHFDETYFFARLAGFGPERARNIAVPSFYIDYHAATSTVSAEWRAVSAFLQPLTLPYVLLSGVVKWAFLGVPADRAFGGSTAEATRWGIGPLAHRLHFPAKGMNDPTRPAFRKDPSTGRLIPENPEALMSLRVALRELRGHDPDEGRALALLGIALHTIQDSYKHAGYTPSRGHIGVTPSPDDVSHRPELAREIMDATHRCLIHARRLLLPGEASGKNGFTNPAASIYDAPLENGETWEARWSGMSGDVLGDPMPTWKEAVEAWKREGGEQAFGRAIDLLRKDYDGR